MNAANESEPGDIELLLPWHAAGTLGRRDTQRVEAALANDPELARRYELVREELGADNPSQRDLGRAVGARHDRRCSPRSTPSRRAGRRHRSISARGSREFFAELSPRTLAWSASAAALAIVLQAGTDRRHRCSRKRARAAMKPRRRRRASSGEGSYALIRFQPQASAAESPSSWKPTNSALRTGRPRAGYTAYASRRRSFRRPDLARVVKELQDDTVVGFMAATQ